VDAVMPDGSRLHVVIPDITRPHMGFSTYRTTSGDVMSLSINSSLTPDTAYYYQLETGTNRTVVASGTFRTLP
jgi:phosphodiesterase/alkaline phosphatase D-like protein